MDDRDRPTLELASGIRSSVVDHANAGVPAEVCGVLGGDHGDEQSVATRVLRAENVADHPQTEYEIDPAVALELIETLEDGGDDLVGFYHSHPHGPPAPSETDRTRAAWPGYSYVLVVPGTEPTVRSWRWTGDSFVEEQLVAPE